MKIFIICPVRKITEHQKIEIDEYINKMINDGNEVHSYKNVEQNDISGGLNICQAHKLAMKDCDEVHVFFDQTSTGAHFDFGMAFAFNKKIKLIKTYQNTPEGKSYQKVLEIIGK